MNKKYSDFYKTNLGKKILEKEVKYISTELKNYRKILSIGCGPAIQEAELAKIYGKQVIGLDNSKEMLDQAPKGVLTVFGDADHMEFGDKTFDAILYIVSLEFIEDYRKAIKEAYRILKPKGKILALTLNPNSDYFKREYSDRNSYIRKNIKHMDVKELEKFVSSYFNVETEYFLGILEDKVFDSSDPKIASLYIIKGTKRRVFRINPCEVIY